MTTARLFDFGLPGVFRRFQVAAVAKQVGHLLRPSALALPQTGHRPVAFQTARRFRAQRVARVGALTLSFTSRRCDVNIYASTSTEGISDLARTSSARGIFTIRSCGAQPAEAGNWLAKAVMSVPMMAKSPSTNSQMSGQPYVPWHNSPVPLAPRRRMNMGGA